MPNSTGTPCSQLMLTRAGNALYTEYSIHMHITLNREAVWNTQHKEIMDSETNQEMVNTKLGQRA